jgi:hypothetical protein
MTATHVTVTDLAARSGHVGHKLYMGNYFSSPASFDDLHTKTMNCCGTVRTNRKWIPKNSGHKTKIKSGDLKTKAKGNLTATVWKDKQNVNTMTSMHSPPLEGNFCNEHGKAMKPAIIQDCNRDTGYVAKSDCIMNSYSISRRTSKWTKKLFFNLMDLTILNGFTILTS